MPYYCRDLDPYSEKIYLNGRDLQMLHDVCRHFLDEVEAMRQCMLNDDVFIQSAEDLLKVSNTLENQTKSAQKVLEMIIPDMEEGEILNGS